jgi:hypothetical protein
MELHKHNIYLGKPDVGKPNKRRRTMPFFFINKEYRSYADFFKLVVELRDTMVCYSPLQNAVSPLALLPLSLSFRLLCYGTSNLYNWS